MEPRSKKAVLFLVIVSGVVVVVAAGFALKRPLLEKWYLWKLESGDEEERKTSAERLGEMGSKSAVRPLIELLRREVVEENAARALGLMMRNELLDSEAESVIPAIIETLQDEHVRFRSGIAFFLGSITPPTKRGLDAALTHSVRLFPTWDKAGKVVLLTANYEIDGMAHQTFEFPTDANARKTSDGWMTVTTIGTGVKARPITYEYAVPDFLELEKYLKYRKDFYRQAGTASKGLPVEIYSSGQVPWQMVVNILDICKRLNISDISLVGRQSQGGAARERVEPTLR